MTEEKLTRLNRMSHAISDVEHQLSALGHDEAEWARRFGSEIAKQMRTIAARDLEARLAQAKAAFEEA